MSQKPPASHRARAEVARSRRLAALATAGGHRHELGLGCRQEIGESFEEIVDDAREQLFRAILSGSFGRAPECPSSVSELLATPRHDSMMSTPSSVSTVTVRKAHSGASVTSAGIRDRFRRVRDAPSIVPPGSRLLEDEERLALLDEMEDIVERSHLFKSLDVTGRARVLGMGVVVGYAEGDVILLQGAEGETMYLVLSGKVRVTTEAANGEVMLAELGRDACFGEVSLLTGCKRTATVVALSDVDCVAFERHRIERVLADYPKVRAILESLVEGRARDTVEKIIKS